MLIEAWVNTCQNTPSCAGKLLRTTCGKGTADVQKGAFSRWNAEVLSSRMKLLCHQILDWNRERGPLQSGISVHQQWRPSDSELSQGFPGMAELTSARTFCTWKYATSELWCSPLTNSDNKPWWEAGLQNCLWSGLGLTGDSVPSEKFTSYLRASIYSFVINPESPYHQAASWLIGTIALLK